jgi:hypothetical protein
MAGTCGTLAVSVNNKNELVGPPYSGEVEEQGAFLLASYRVSEAEPEPARGPCATGGGGLDPCEFSSDPFCGSNGGGNCMLDGGSLPCDLLGLLTPGGSVRSVSIVGGYFRPAQDRFAAIPIFGGVIPIPWTAGPSEAPDYLYFPFMDQLGGGGNSSGGGVAPKGMYLQVKRDCFDGRFRNTDYALMTNSGAVPSGQYQVTEHQTNSLFTRPNKGPAGPGTTTQDGTNGPLNQFNDLIGSIFSLSSESSKQTFTISSGSPANSPSYPVFVRNSQGDFGTLGIYISAGAPGKVFVNGKQAPPCP